MPAGIKSWGRVYQKLRTNNLGDAQLMEILDLLMRPIAIQYRGVPIRGHLDSIEEGDSQLILKIRVHEVGPVEKT